jgi:DNA-binding transcriptional LysR family regulator
MRFSFRQLEYFVAAGEAGSIRRAAERVAVSQPSISAAVSHLERELGVQLFVRHHAQGLSLTPAGRRLLREARLLLDQAEGLHALAGEVSGQLRGRLGLGCFVTLAPMILPELVAAFTRATPGAEVAFFEADQARLVAALRQVEIDLALAYDLQLPDDIEFEPLAELPPYILLAESHPLAERPMLTLEELAPLPLVLLDLPLSREYFLAMFLREGLEPTVAARSAQQEVLRTMVANGLGYTIANVRPRSNLALDGRRLARVPLVGGHPPMRLGLARAKSLQPSRLAESFAEHCRHFISNAYIPGMDAPYFTAVSRRTSEGAPSDVGPSDVGPADISPAEVRAAELSTENSGGD